MGTCYT